MARSSRNSKLETRSARVKLKAQHEPYWTSIGRGLYLGYRKGIKGSMWIARYYLDDKYKKQVIGIADDFRDSNNIDVFDYFQAQDKVRSFALHQAKQANTADKELLTINDVVEHYLAWFKAHRKSYTRTCLTFKAHVLPSLGGLKIAKLTPQTIRTWHEHLINEPPRLRSATAQKNYASIDHSPEGARKRKATANRILTILKAALNRAWQDGLIASNEAWSKVKPFQNVNAPKIRYLELSECERLINACEPDFRQLVRAALLTGCRYGELTKLKNGDFNGTLHITETKNGKPRHIPLTDEGVTFFEEMTAGRSKQEHVFLRDDGQPWGISHQSRRLKEACEIAKIKPEISFHVLRHTYGSLLASKGVPLQVIAELLGHSDTRITSRHYAHLTPSFVSV